MSLENPNGHEQQRIDWLHERATKFVGLFELGHLRDAYDLLTSLKPVEAIVVYGLVESKLTSADPHDEGDESKLKQSLWSWAVARAL